MINHGYLFFQSPEHGLGFITSGKEGSNVVRGSWSRILACCDPNSDRGMSNVHSVDEANHSVSYILFRPNTKHNALPRFACHPLGQDATDPSWANEQLKDALKDHNEFIAAKAEKEYKKNLERRIKSCKLDSLRNKLEAMKKEPSPKAWSVSSIIIAPHDSTDPDEPTGNQQMVKLYGADYTKQTTLTAVTWEQKLTTLTKYVLHSPNVYQP